MFYILSINYVPKTPLLMLALLRIQFNQMLSSWVKHSGDCDKGTIYWMAVFWFGTGPCITMMLSLLDCTQPHPNRFQVILSLVGTDKERAQQAR
jgi:hypothetical protein